MRGLTTGHEDAGVPDSATVRVHGATLVPGLVDDEVVIVRITDFSGTDSNRPFHFSVAC